jgi:uncharacterized protein (TIGR03435 family)
MSKSSRTLAAIGGIGILEATAILGQTPAPRPQFEVASIKPADPGYRPGRLGASIQTSKGLLVTPGATLKEMIAAAYALESYQVSGGAAWADSARFAVEAKPTNGATREQLLPMLQPLLADRFKLAFHRETRQLAVYALVVARNGPKLHRLKPGTESEPGKLNRLGRNVDMAWFARYLTHFGADKPVIDKTGLAGNFDLDLDMEKILAEAASGGAEGTPPGINSIFEATVNALDDRLGLKLAPTKAPVEVLVIDRAERPSAN